MEWIILFIAFDFLALAILLSRPDPVTSEVAQHMRGDALLIDVRRPTEFAVSHLPNAVNIPISSIGWLVPKRVRDTNRVLLLHGTVGLRGALARNRLQALGYTNVFNLGSYDRAAQIASKNQPTRVWSDSHRDASIEEAIRQKESSRRRFGATVRVGG